MGKIFKVVVHCVRGLKVIGLCKTEEQMKCATLLQLKEKIVQRLRDLRRADYSRLTFCDRLLIGDSSLLREYGIRNMSVIHATSRVPGGGSEDGGMGGRGKNRSMEKLSDL